MGLFSEILQRLMHSTNHVPCFYKQVATELVGFLLMEVSIMTGVRLQGQNFPTYMYMYDHKRIYFLSR